MPAPRRGASATAALFALAILLAAWTAGCGGKNSPMQPGVTRPYLGLTANLAPSEASSYLTVLSRVRSSGADMQYVSLQWDTFAPDPGPIDASSVRALVDGLEGLFGYAVYLNLATIDTNNDRRPLYLRARAWDDPVVEARLDSTIDALVSALQHPTPRPLIAFAIGNEVDAYLSAHPSERLAYERLLAHEYAHFHAVLPGTPVGVSTISPMNSPDAAIADSIQALGDLVIYTYYPFQGGSDFVHRPTTTLEPDFDAMSVRAGAKPWALQEVGYTSSPVNGSSGAAQADFVRRFRARIGRESRDRLLFANWFLYTDFSSTLVQQLTGYYGFTSPGFVAYLGNLGLRDSLGGDKPAWAAWKQGP